MEDGFYDATAAEALPEKYRERLRWADMLERSVRKIRSREKVIRIFPNMESAYRLVEALCLKPREEWSTGRRYLNIDGYFQWRADRSGGDPPARRLRPAVSQTLN
ncbi:transposase [Salinibacter altiplanensis]|uniref:transposase n=1 Tax=Salinibacter altiplanensis TaxID=1803181 RepID=UPI00131A5D3E